MTSITQITRIIEDVAPPGTALEWDNVGLQVGDPAWSVTLVLVTLDVTAQVVDEAENLGAELIVAHHPLIFHPLAALRTDRPVGRLVARLTRAQIGLYVAHTNLDAAPDVGTAAALGRIVGLRDTAPLLEEDELALGLVGKLPEEATVGELAARLREELAASRVIVVGDADRQARRVALMPGSGGDAVPPAAASGADVLVCGDLTHHDALDALGLGLCVIDAGHYGTERPVVDSLADYLQERLTGAVNIRRSQVRTDPFA